MTELPRRLRRDGRPYLPKSARKSIKLDTIRAADFNRFDLRFFCEDCSFFDRRSGPEGQRCSLGYRARHTRAEQLKLYERTGQMALCRAIEID